MMTANGYTFQPVPVLLSKLSAQVLLQVQAAYLKIPFEERADRVHARIDEIALEVSERARPLPSNLPTLTAARGDWRVRA